MISIGIMSMHRIRNYGSTLQAYGLRRLIEDVVPGARVSYVDFRPGAVLGNGRAPSATRVGRVLDKVGAPSAVGVPWRDRLRFVEHKLAYAGRYFPAAGIPRALNHDLHLDCQVIGSDEVFNCVQSNPRVGYARDLFGHRSPARRVISYAASFGNTTLDKLRAVGLEEELRRDLSRFAALSVRDGSSREIVGHLLGHDPLIHVDPVLAYDLVNDPRVPRGRLHEEPYLVAYGYSGRLTAAENDAVRRCARRIGARVLTFGGVQACGDAFVDCSPFELVASIRDSVGVVTDTFHGTILAIITGRPFAAVVRPSAGGRYGNEEKLGFLLDSFGLSGRRLDDVSQLGPLLASPLDDEEIAATLTVERARARQYLTTAVVG